MAQYRQSDCSKVDVPRNRFRLAFWIALIALATSATSAAPIVGKASRQVERRDGDHLYRIIGKVRLLLFWVSADDVGGARISWRGAGDDQSVALLIGSEPRRAPRGVNEWGYIREHAADDTTTVFGVRTVTDGDSPADADARRPAPGSAAEIGVLCSTVSSIDAMSRTATVHVPGDATYRDIDRVLTAIERNAHWNKRRTSRPADAAPGFLTALDGMIRASAFAARDADAMPICQRVAFVYKDAIYDLIPRRVQRIPYLRTNAGVLRDLVRSELSVRNRATGSTSGFSVTYGTAGALAGVPVAATYQPNWWFKVELELDERQNVPPDPAADGSLRRTLASVCSAIGETTP
jgi:hypothetical protein